MRDYDAEPIEITDFSKRFYFDRTLSVEDRIEAIEDQLEKILNPKPMVHTKPEVLEL